MVEVTLSEFAIPTLQSFSGGLDEFVLKRLQHASNSALVQLAEHLGYSKAKIVAPHDGADIWDQGQLRVFYPFVRTQGWTASLQKCLSKFGISAFVAHSC